MMESVDVVRPRGIQTAIRAIERSHTEDGKTSRNLSPEILSSQLFQFFIVNCEGGRYTILIDKDFFPRFFLPTKPENTKHKNPNLSKFSFSVFIFHTSGLNLESTFKSSADLVSYIQ